MANRILTIYIFTLFCLLITTSVIAQENMPKNWDTEKIRGTRHLPYPSATGFPYLNDRFSPGEIEFLSGIKVGNIGLRYSSYRDEIIYYNTAIGTQIEIDKMSLKGFDFTDADGNKRIFRRQHYDGYFSNERYFEVLGDGEISLLAYRKVALQICPTYTDDSGKLKNMSYQNDYSFYFYAKDKGYSQVKITKSSLLSKFDKLTQKTIKKLLRRNGVQISDETSFIHAWNLIKENGIKLIF
jgi:hypothetical protein